MMNEELKNALLAFIGLGESIEDKLEDGKITVIETLQLVPKAFGLIAVFQNRKIILDQLKDLTDEGREELVVWFSAELDLDNDKAEEIAELLFSVLTSFLVLVPTMRQSE